MKSVNTLLLCLCLFFNFAGELYSQNETSQKATETQIERNDELLIRETTEELAEIRQALTVSNEFDLILWAQSLGLTTEGSRAELEKRIVDYYFTEEAKIIPSTSAMKSSPKEGERIVITNANSVDYFTLEEVDEEMIRLLGGVRIIFVQAKKNRDHVITADKVIFNKKNKRGTAFGNVSYRVYPSSQTYQYSQSEAYEQLYASHILFSIDDFSFDATRTLALSESEVKYDEGNKSETLAFNIFSPTISRSPEDVLVLEDVEFSTSNESTPLYSIRIKKLYLLAPEEWAVDRASVYLGNIPVFWIPFFFNPGDRFFFSPAVGFKLREGGYINTTTYFFGEIPDSEKEDFFSFFNFSKSDKVERRISGLYLVRKEEDESQEGEVEVRDNTQQANNQDANINDTQDKSKKGAPTFNINTDGWLVRLMLDYYTNLGVHAGVETDFKNIPYIDNLQMNLGLGFTNAVFKLSDTEYYSLYPDEGEFKRHFDEGIFFNTKIPLRYKIKLNTEISWNILSTALYFTMFSDQYFDADFANRNFDFSWNKLFDQNNDIKELNARSGNISSYSWRTGLGISVPQIQAIQPYVSSLRLGTINIEMDWRSKRTEDVPEFYARENVDQKIEETFFYPDSLELPSYSAGMSGQLVDLDFSDLIDWSTESEKKSPDDIDGISDLEPQATPSYEPASAISVDQDSLQDITVPSPHSISIERETSSNSSNTIIDNMGQDQEISAYSVVPEKELFDARINTLGIGYALSHSLTNTFTVDDDLINKAQDIDFFNPDLFPYLGIATQNSGSLNAKIGLLDDILLYNYSIDLYYRKNFTQYLTDVDQELKDDREKVEIANTKEDLENTHNIALYPLRTIPLLAGSSINYNIAFSLGKNIFSSVEEATWFDSQDDEWWNTHSLGATLSLQQNTVTTQFTLRAELPPKGYSYNLGYNQKVWLLSFSASTRFYYEKREDNEFDDELLYTPLNTSLSMTIPTFPISLSSSLVYNYEDLYADSLNTAIRLWDLSASLNFQYIKPKIFNVEELRSVIDENTPKTLRPDALRIQYNLPTKEQDFGVSFLSFKPILSTSYTQRFQDFVSSNFLFTYGFNVQLFGLFALNFKSSIINDVPYLYFDEYVNQIDPALKRNVWDDVINGISVWDQSKLQDSAFKLQSISLNIVQNFGGWLLEFGYTGRPNISVTQDTDNVWDNELTIAVYWKALSLFKSETFYRDEEWAIEEEFK